MTQEIIANAWKLSNEEGYCGQLNLLVIGTNDASQIHNASNLASFRSKYMDFCLKLLAVPGLVLMPCSLLPRNFQPNRPNANPNMYPGNSAIRSVCKELRKNPLFVDKIRFSNIGHDIAEVVPVADPTLPLPGMGLRPCPGVLKPDNVHLKPDGNSTMVRNLLTQVNLFPNSCFGIKKKPKE